MVGFVEKIVMWELWFNESGGWRLILQKLYWNWKYKNYNANTRQWHHFLRTLTLIEFFLFSWLQALVAFPLSVRLHVTRSNVTKIVSFPRPWIKTSTYDKSLQVYRFLFLCFNEMSQFKKKIILTRESVNAEN